MSILKIGGKVSTINSQSIRVLERDYQNYVSSCSGTVLITAGGAGYAVGCRYLKTDGASGAIEFINVGSTSSCLFVAREGQAEVSITNAEMLALRATPKTLVAAPGAGFFLEFVQAQLFFDYTGAYTETADNMAVKLGDGSGTAVSQTIEATGFVDATADTITNALPKIDAIVSKTNGENKALVLHNTGDGEYGGGNAANAIRVKVRFRIHATGF